MSTIKLKDSSYSFLEQLLKVKSLHDGADEFDSYQCLDFWCSEDVVKWFTAQGYMPYTRNPDEFEGVPSLHTSPSLPFDIIQEAENPYAYHHAQGTGESTPSLAARDYTGRMIFAQDRQLRHVVIKAMHTESEEYRVVHYLSQQSPESMRASCVLPVIELLYFEKACFAVMPRWGRSVLFPQCHTMRSLLLIMQSLLKALAFLHSHNIVHRDLSFENVLVNHFGSYSDYYWPTRRPYMSAGLLSYALIDFDLAMRLPCTTDRKSFTLPFHNAFQGSGGPNDVSQGELDYNPYAYDVGCLGVMFCSSYQHHTRDLPLLAPLLDKMVTRNISQRFTTEEALLFVEQILTEAEPSQLSIVERPDPCYGAFDYETYNRWQDIPRDFQQRWASYREPFGVPLTSKILRAIIRSRIIPSFAKPRIRWLISKGLYSKRSSK